MLISLIKFIHILLVLGLIGGIGYCFMTTSSRQSSLTFTQFSFLHRLLLWLSLLLGITGTLLVYPRHFTFHTPWIKAAYVLLFAVTLGILFLKRRISHLPPTPTLALARQGSYFFIILLLFLIVHDAVTKTTFLFY